MEREVAFMFKETGRRRSLASVTLVKVCQIQKEQIPRPSPSTLCTLLLYSIPFQYDILHASQMCAVAWNRCNHGSNHEEVGRDSPAHREESRMPMYSL
jgi:hypothetical protein